MKSVYMPCWLLLLLALSFTAQCAPQIVIMQHTPLHPANNLAVTFRIQASSDVGISRVSLSLQEYTCVKQPDGNRSTILRDGSPVQSVQEWTYSTPKRMFSESTQFLKGFPANTLVCYTVQVIDANGTTSQTVSMQAGDSPYGNEEILLYTTAENETVGTFRVCFIPDTKDFGSDTKRFRDSLQTTIYKGYLRSNVIRDNSQRWAFYYTPITRKWRNRNIPSEVAGLDAYGFMHTANEGDASSGQGFSSETNYIGTAVHELAHVLFNLNDEYSGTGSTGGCNVFRDKQACKEANGNRDCRSFSVDGKTAYTPESGGIKCIMRSDGDKRLPDFLSHCQQCVTKAYSELNLQHTLSATTRFSAKPEEKSTLPTSQTTKSIVMQLNFDKGKWQASILGTKFGKPSRNTNQSNAIIIKALNKNGMVLYTWSIADPRIETVHTASETVNQKLRDSSTIYLLLPFDGRITSIQLSHKNIARKMLTQNFDVGIRIQHLLSE